MPEDLNETRRMRATSDREIILGPYTFERVISAPPEVLVGFHRPDETSVDEAVIERFDATILSLLEPIAKVTETGAPVSTKDAWHQMRTEGDENGVLSFNDMGEVVKLLLGGVVERPTEAPSDSPGGSAIPTTGTPSTALSPSGALPSMASIPAAS